MFNLIHPKIGFNFFKKYLMSFLILNMFLPGFVRSTNQDRHPEPTLLQIVSESSYFYPLLTKGLFILEELDHNRHNPILGAPNTFKLFLNGCFFNRHSHLVTFFMIFDNILKRLTVHNTLSKTGLLKEHCFSRQSCLCLVINLTFDHENACSL